MYVNLEPNNITKQTNNIDSLIEEYNDGVTSVKNTVNDIGNIWKGKDYDQFVSRMDDFTQELTEFERSLESFNKFVSDYIEASTKLDNHYGNKKIDIN